MPRHILVALWADPLGSAPSSRSGARPTSSTCSNSRPSPRPSPSASTPGTNFVFPETRATRPPYANLCVYDLDESQIEAFLNPDLSTMEAPQPPAGGGPHRPDGYLFVAPSPEFRKEQSFMPGSRCADEVIAGLGELRDRDASAEMKGPPPALTPITSSGSRSSICEATPRPQSPT